MDLEAVVETYTTRIITIFVKSRILNIHEGFTGDVVKYSSAFGFPFVLRSCNNIQNIVTVMTIFKLV